jgi:hypothetical protein
MTPDDIPPVLPPLVTHTPDQLEALTEWRAYAARILAAGRQPGHALTREQYDALMVGRDRPLTQSAMTRHRASGNANMLGETA